MNIISWNVNGLRAVEKKGALAELIASYAPDILLFQEIKAKPEQLSKLHDVYSEYDQFYHSAEKAGYSGTGIWVKKNIFSEYSFAAGMPNFADTEGRITRIDIDQYSIFSLYFPNGGKSDEAWHGKIAFYHQFLRHINTLRSEGRKVIWAGDINCAHEEIDLARPKDNLNSIGFLPEERNWVSQVITEDWIDIFRHLHPQKIVYSWWHVISRARERNVGWRIDYFFTDTKILSQVHSITYLNEQMGSDHCPVQLGIDL